MVRHFLLSLLGGCGLLLTATFAFGELRIAPGDGPLQLHIDAAAPGSEQRQRPTSGFGGRGLGRAQRCGHGSSILTREALEPVPYTP